MNCQEAQPLLHAYMDHELDLRSSLTFETHLRECSACSEQLARQQHLRKVVATHARYYYATPAVQNAICQVPPTSPVNLARWWNGWRTTLPAMALAASLTWIALVQMAPFLLMAPTDQQEKVVYHISTYADASNGLRNAMNLLDETPGAKVIVVAHNDGVNFLIDGATDSSGRPYRVAVTRLVARGVDFRVCKNTLTRRQVSFDKIIPEAHLVASGVAEIARLQAKEGYVYLNP